MFRTSERIAGRQDAKQESHKGRAGEDAGTHDHRRRAGEQESRRATKREPERMKAGKPKQKYFFVLYIGTEKYLQKKFKKIWKCEKAAVSL